MKEEQIKRDLIKIEEEEGALALIIAALRQGDAILTGALGAKRLELLMVPGRLVQAARNNKFLQQLAQEFENLRKKGEIKDDYANSEQARSCLQELLSALEKPPVDETKFHILKSIFLRASKEKLTSRDDPTPQLLMSIAKELSSGEILLLSAVHKINISNKFPTDATQSAERWIQHVSRNSSLSTKGMVEFYENKLVVKKLLTDRIYPDRSGVDGSSSFRLTDLGRKICEFFVEDSDK